MSHCIAAAEEFGLQIHDFALLYGCDYVMGTVSTFSEIACLLGGKPHYVFAESNQSLTSLEDFKIPDLKNRILPL